MLKWQTLTSYQADGHTVTPPVDPAMSSNPQPTRSINDGHGNLAYVDEYTTATAFDRTAYTYTPGNELAGITDPAGNVTTQSYNWLGWRTGLGDPDQGTSSYGYDLAGNATRVTDASGTQTWTVFDTLNRPASRRAGIRSSGVGK